MKVTILYLLASAVFSLAYAAAEQNGGCEKFEAVCALCESHKTENIKEQIKEAVSEEVDAGLAECQAELEQREKKLLSLLGKCPVRYGNKCFWAIFTGPSTMNQQQASDLCEDEGGNLTGVYSNDHLNQLIMVALPHAAAKSNGDIWIWTGMTYENNKLKQENGSLGPHLKWAPGYPRQDDSSYNIVIAVRVDRNNEGLITLRETEAKYGAFCEIEY